MKLISAKVIEKSDQWLVWFIDSNCKTYKSGLFKSKDEAIRHMNFVWSILGNN
jgi:hypothetical protein